MNIKKTITALMLMVTAVTPSALAANFTDTRGHWAENIIDDLADRNIVSGVSEKEFDPDGTVTRAEFLRMALGAAGIDTQTPYREGECLDVKKDAWYATSVQSALDKGLIPDAMIENFSVEIVTDETGSKAVYSGRFNAEQPILREEMAYIAQEAYQYSLDKDSIGNLENPVDLTFDDVNMISLWALDGVRHAYANDLVSGMDDDTFHPKETATRAQAATIIHNMIDR